MIRAPHVCLGGGKGGGSALPGQGASELRILSKFPWSLQIQPFFFGLLFTKPVATGILAGLLLGKPLGIVGASLLGVKLGLAEMPQGMDTKHLAVLGLLGSIGFTMSLLMISLALGDYPDSTRLSKLAVVLTSGVAAIGSAAIMTTLPDTAQAEEEPAPAAPTSEVISLPSAPTPTHMALCRLPGGAARQGG